MDINKQDLYHRVRYGILTPRIAFTNPSKTRVQKAFPNMYGGFKISSEARTSYRSEQFLGDF